MAAISDSLRYISEKSDLCNYGEYLSFHQLKSIRDNCKPDGLQHHLSSHMDLIVKKSFLTPLMQNILHGTTRYLVTWHPDFSTCYLNVMRLLSILMNLLLFSVIDYTSHNRNGVLVSVVTVTERFKE